MPFFPYHEDLSEEAKGLLQEYDGATQSSAVAIADHLTAVAANGGEQAEDSFLAQEARTLARHAEHFAEELKRRSDSAG